MFGDGIVTCGIRANERLQARFQAFGEKIGNSTVLSRSKASTLAGWPGDSEHRSKNDEAYLDLLFMCKGFTSLAKSGYAYFFTRPFQSRRHFRGILDDMRKVMSKCINPVPASEVFDALEVAGTLNGVDVDAIENILVEAAEYEEIPHEGPRVFRLRFRYLPTLVDKSVRILTERGQPMHIRDLCLEIDKRLGLVGTSQRVNTRSLSKRLSQSRIIVPTSSRCDWALAEWNLPRMQLRDMVVRVLENAGEPLLISQIFGVIREEDSSIRLRTIRHCIQDNGEFIRIKDRKITLAHWGGGEE
jgi:hypothetical protein